MLAILDSVVNMIGGPMWQLKKHDDVHFDDK